MLVYDIRIQHYPQNAVTALYNKIIDMTQLKPSAKEEQLATVETLLNKMGDNAFPDMLVRYMGLVCNFYMEEKRTADDVMDAYTRVMAVFEAQEVKQPDSEVVRANKQLIENMLISSGVATCENLIALFTPRFIANPEDLELVSKIVSLLSSSDCGNSELFLQTVTTLNRLSPSYKTAYYLSKLHAAKGEFNEAVKYVREAINSPDITAVEKGQYLIDEGLFYFRNLNNQSRAMTAAKAAIEAHPSVKGKAYMLIASIWTRQNCGDTDIERRAPYWVAVDYFARAKAADPSCAAEADRMIAQFRQHFPLQEEAFMYDLSEGSEYTVVCNGMTEKTTVRTRK
jgi:tetratricopeptide (TPR) repeat protein